MALMGCGQLGALGRVCSRYARGRKPGSRCPGARDTVSKGSQRKLCCLVTLLAPLSNPGSWRSVSRALSTQAPAAPHRTVCAPRSLLRPLMAVMRQPLPSWRLHFAAAPPRGGASRRLPGSPPPLPPSSSPLLPDIGTRRRPDNRWCGMPPWRMAQGCFDHGSGLVRAFPNHVGPGPRAAHLPEHDAQLRRPPRQSTILPTSAAACLQHASAYL